MSRRFNRLRIINDDDDDDDDDDNDGDDRWCGSKRWLGFYHKFKIN